jgi:hypothetical protein
MNLTIESLDQIEAPLSNDFWTGFLGGAGLVIAVAGLSILIT